LPDTTSQAAQRPERAPHEVLPPSWEETGGGHRLIAVFVAVPGVLALVLMLLSWLLPRTRTAELLVLAGMVVLFGLQFGSARRYEQGALRAAMTAFSVVLLYFAVFGVVYAEYADLANEPRVFSTDRLGEAFLVSVSIGTATGYVPASAGAGNVGFLAIVNTQMIMLAVAVASSAAGSMARVVQRRRRLHGGATADGVTAEVTGDG
jgi:hypothetical protein